MSKSLNKSSLSFIKILSIVFLLAHNISSGDFLISFCSIRRAQRYIQSCIIAKPCHGSLCWCWGDLPLPRHFSSFACMRIQEHSKARCRKTVRIRLLVYMCVCMYVYTRRWKSGIFDEFWEEVYFFLFFFLDLLVNVRK